MSNYEPVKVSIGVENPSLERGAFYNICFITENDIAPRTLQVNRLSDLLDNGYSRLDLAYNFCVGVFSQQGMDTVYIRAKRSYESYVEAYNSDDNSMYYFVVLQTKDLTEVEKFNSHLVSSDEMKLQFFSQNIGSKILKSPKLVNYYQDYTLSGGVPVESKDYYLNKAYDGVTVDSKIPLPDYLLGGYGNTAVDYGVRIMVGKDYIWEIDKEGRRIRYAPSSTPSPVENWEYLPIYDVAVQVKRNSIAGHAESIEAVNNSLPFKLPNYEPNVTITGIAKVGEILTAMVTDANGVPSNINFQWYADGKVISGATSETYILKEAETGKSITVKAEFTDKDGFRESVTDTVDVEVVDKPENQIANITISGVAKVGETLIAELTDSNGLPSNINYQWYASDEVISGATSNTYTPNAAQVGRVITVKANFIDNDGYAELVTSAATETVQPIEIVEEGVDVKDFDFAVVKYQWSEADGTDLDTRTWISSPDRSEHKVGWSRLSNDLNYLQWNQDNTGSGVESVLIDMKSIQKDFPSQKDIAIKMAAFWFSAISSGNVRLQFSLFKGGIMKSSSNFDWVNEGGREVQNITLSANTQILTSEDVNGQLLATLKFNTDTGVGSLTNPAGVIGVDNPVLPEIVPTGLPLKFSTENWSGTGELPIKLQLVNPIGDWFLAAQGLPVASFNGILAEGVTSTPSDNGITLLLNNTYQDIMDYELLGQFESVTLSSGEVGATGEVSVTQFGEEVGKHLFSLTGLDLKVPTQLPASITSTNKMFSGSSYISPDLTTWDVSNVTDMSYMFEGCTDFDVPLDTWNVSNVTNMEGMFKDCDSFNTDISSWNTSAVTNMSYMFSGSSIFNKDLSTWDVSNVIDMSFMFNKAYDFAGDISNWDVSNVTNMAHMFETGYFNQDISPWNVSNVTNMDYMFNLAEEFNQDLSQWCVKKIPVAPVKFDTAPLWTAAKPVWGTCPEKAPVVPEPNGEVFTFSALNDSGGTAPIEVQVQDAVGDWAIREDGIVIATSSGYMNNRFTLTSDDTSSYITIPVTEEVAKSYEVIGKMDEVKLSHKILNNSYVVVEILTFGEEVNSHKFNLPYTDLIVPSTLPSHVKTTQYMFQNCDEFNQDLSTWDVSNVTNMQGMFKGCEYFNQSNSSWNTTNVTDMSYMFEGCIAFDMPLNTWDVSNVTNMQGMFKGCETFNGDISSWNVSNVIDMSYMFMGCVYFNIAISNWKPLNATNMSNMFDGCETFDQLISQWKTPKAEDMSYMFNNCYSYNRAMAAWDVSSVTNMQSMFKECYLFNKPLTLWNVSNVTDMSRMFEWCEVYNQDLSQWCVTKIMTKPVGFDNNASAWTRAKPVWGTCPRGEAG